MESQSRSGNWVVEWLRPLTSDHKPQYTTDVSFIMISRRNGGGVDLGTVA
jgi:hypothetical protein